MIILVGKLLLVALIGGQVIMLFPAYNEVLAVVTLFCIWLVLRHHFKRG